jgi:hypothetical protein
MKRLFDGKRESPSKMIQELLFQGRNSIQIFLAVKDQYPDYEETKLRNLISVVKAKTIKKN